MSLEFDPTAFERMLGELELDRERIAAAACSREPKRALRAVLLGAAGGLARGALRRFSEHLPEALLIGGLLLAAVLAPGPRGGTPGPGSMEWRLRQSDAWTAKYLNRAAEIEAKKKQRRSADAPVSSWGPGVGSKRPWEARPVSQPVRTRPLGATAPTEPSDP